MNTNIAGADCGNKLLAALRTAEYTAIRPYIMAVDYPLGHTLYHPGDDVEHAYFPRGSAVASFLIVMEDGRTVETAMVGREGAIGGIVSHGRLPAYAKSAVMHGGSFFRVPSIVLENAKRESPHMQYLFARYADCLIAQIFQSVACNAAHTIEQRAAKWLISAMDRTGFDELALTQDQLGSLLGVGRSYVCRIIARFKDEQIIATRRGGIRILDPDRLRATGCECSRLVADHFDTVLRGVYPDPDELQQRAG